MPDEPKGWPPVLLISSKADHIEKIRSGLKSSGFASVASSNFDEANITLAAGNYGLTIVDMTDDIDIALQLLSDLLNSETAILALVARIDQNVVKAIKAGADSVAIYPGDVSRIGLPAILAFDRARARLNLIDSNFQVREKIRLGNARIRSIVHDLKNPLTVTMGNLQVLQSMTQDTMPENAVKMVVNALRGCRTQLNMMSNLSDLVKMEENRFHVELESFELTPIIKQVIDDFASTDTRKEYKFEIKSAVPVLADQTVVERILQSLLGHAMHYTRNGDEITVTLGHEAEQNMVTVIVSDNGEAIPTELGDAIFDSAAQALDNANHTRWDRGMMLAYARIALRNLGGDAILDEQPEKGARIKVMIPAARVGDKMSSE